jgi:hypothetical protein
MWEDNKVPSIVKMSEEEYRELSHCSYSFLSKLDQMGYRAFESKPKVGKAMNLGSFIDCYILTPDELEEKFVKTLPPPTSSKKILADFVIENFDELPTKEHLFELSRSLGLWSKWTTDRVIKGFDAEFIDYLKTSIENKYKTPYTDEDLELANVCLNSLLNSHLTEHIFSPENYNLETLFQTKGIFELDDLHIKFMVDILTIDRSQKQVSIYDLKTGEEPLDSFEKSFIKYRYDIQYYLYTKGVSAILKDLDAEGYEVLPLKFIYLYKKAPEIPVIYKVPKALDIYEGYTTKYGYEITGVKQLIDDYKFYNGGYSVPRRVAENNGVVILDI